MAEGVVSNDHSYSDQQAVEPELEFQLTFERNPLVDETVVRM